MEKSDDDYVSKMSQNLEGWNNQDIQSIFARVSRKFA